MQLKQNQKPGKNRVVWNPSVYLEIFTNSLLFRH